MSFISKKSSERAIKKTRKLKKISENKERKEREKMWEENRLEAYSLIPP